MRFHQRFLNPKAKFNRQTSNESIFLVTKVVWIPRVRKEDASDELSWTFQAELNVLLQIRAVVIEDADVKPQANRNDPGFVPFAKPGAGADQRLAVTKKLMKNLKATRICNQSSTSLQHHQHPSSTICFRQLTLQSHSSL